MLALTVGQRGVYDPSEGLDPGALQVGLQAIGFVHGCGLGQGDHKNPRELRVAQSREQLADLIWNVRGGALHLSLVALCGVEQEQGVAGRAVSSTTIRSRA